MDSFETDIARSRCLHVMSSRHEMCTPNVSNMIYHKFSQGAASCMVNGKNINVTLEFQIIFLTIHKKKQKKKTYIAISYENCIIEAVLLRRVFFMAN